MGKPKSNVFSEVHQVAMSEKLKNQVKISNFMNAFVNLEPTATKHDDSKPPLDLLPPDVLLEVAKVLKFGADKYGSYNWTKGFDWSRLQAATLRHLSSWSMGEDNDPESQMNHLYHALCSLMFLAAHQQRGLGVDDRHKIKGSNKNG